MVIYGNGNLNNNNKEDIKKNFIHENVWIDSE